MAIQFFDCPNCGKSLRVGARACHHCHASDENDWADPASADELATGGYATDALDDDEDDDSSRGLGSTLRRRIVFGVVALLLVSLLLPYLLPLLQLVAQ